MALYTLFPRVIYCNQENMEMLKSVSMIRLQKITSFVLLADSVSSSQCPLKKKANKRKQKQKTSASIQQPTGS